MTPDIRIAQSQPNFNLIARPYRWLEYCTFGLLLERCRFAQLPHMRSAASALILGDGDGRFLAKLVAGNPSLHADVVDISPAMLGLSRARIPLSDAIRFHQADIRVYQPPAGRVYDLLVTHFFLDCLTESEITQLIDHLRPRFSEQTTWIISEFAIPATGLARPTSQLLIWFLYRAFRLLTGLEVQRLPRYMPILQQAGFVCEGVELFLGGILRSERWQFIARTQATGGGPDDSQ